MQILEKMNINETEYNCLLAELFEKHPSIQNAGFRPGAYKPGLDGMKAFSTALGDPWKDYPCVHVAGTNGKGSVSSMLAAGLASSGLRVGLYTSPHLNDFRERMKIISRDGWEMPGKQWVYDFLKGSNTDGLSFFEITTGMAFRWFSESKVNFAVIETGLGGRLDSTNIILPRLSVITSIGLDHCAMLGDTRAKIAAEKAGIFKPGIPAVVASRDAETSPVFEEIAARTGAPLHYAEDFRGELFPIDLKGPYQAENLRTALYSLELLGVRAERAFIARTGELTGFRGRWEKVLDRPETICDIGHNPAALEKNFAALDESGRPLHIVYGIMADKDLDAILPLLPRRAKYYLAAPKIDRALPVERLAEHFASFDHLSFGSVDEAVHAALSEAQKDENALVYIGGSNYLVSECILSLDKQVS